MNHDQYPTDRFLSKEETNKVMYVVELEGNHLLQAGQFDPFLIQRMLICD